MVATNAVMTKTQSNQSGRRIPPSDRRIARFRRSTRCADGDTIFALTTGDEPGEADVSRIGALAADVMAEANFPSRAVHGPAFHRLPGQS